MYVSAADDVLFNFSDTSLLLLVLLLLNKTDTEEDAPPLLLPLLLVGEETELNESVRFRPLGPVVVLGLLLLAVAIAILSTINRCIGDP